MAFLTPLLLVKLHRGRDAPLTELAPRLLGFRDGTADGNLGAAPRGGMELYGHLLAAMPERQVPWVNDARL